MKAIVCTEHGPASKLAYADVPEPEAGPHGVVVAVKAAGVNFPDTLIIQGKYQLQPPLPFSPGSELAGVVESVGPGTEGVRVGDRVMAFTGFGGFVERIAVDASQLVAMPDGMDFATASGFVTAYATSMHALTDRARLAPGETLLVLGAAGGVGLAAIEIGKAMGARVIAAASTEAKLAVCREHGADETVDYSGDDWRERLKAVTRGAGVDVVYDAVGGRWSEPALRSLAWNGRFLVVGFASGEIPKIPLNLMLLKGCAVVGVFWGAFSAREADKNRANLAQLVAWWREGKLRPRVGRTYPLERAGDALEDLLARRIVGKAVLTVGAG